MMFFLIQGVVCVGAAELENGLPSWTMTISPLSKSPRLDSFFLMSRGTRDRDDRS
jgi:hypothetical protein